MIDLPICVGAAAIMASACCGLLLPVPPSARLPAACCCLLLPAAAAHVVDERTMPPLSLCLLAHLLHARAGIIKALRPDDYVCSTYRDHVHALSKGVPAREVRGTPPPHTHTYKHTTHTAISWWWHGQACIIGRMCSAWV
jgi:hypothetical protein